MLIWYAFPEQFPRPQAELLMCIQANERTWLAWIRTTLSLLSCAFTLQASRFRPDSKLESRLSWRVVLWQVESADASSTVWSRWLFITGALSIVCMEMTYFTGKLLVSAIMCCQGLQVPASRVDPIRKGQRYSESQHSRPVPEDGPLEIKVPDLLYLRLASAHWCGLLGRRLERLPLSS